MTYTFEVFQRMELWAKTTMDAKKLLVHDGRQGQRAEGLHTSVVDLLGVFVFTFKLKGEVIGQMAAFVISS